MQTRLITSIVLLFICAGSFAQKVDNGVSDELAAWRKKEISNIQYRLSFHIPASTRHITAKEVIQFDLKHTDKKLQIDFKTDLKKIKKLVVNNKIVKPLLINEHIVLNPSLLLKKNNQVQIDFDVSGNSIKTDTNGLVYTLFVPANARESFACFDQPDLKASFELTLTIPNTWVSVSNGKAVKETTTSTEKTCYFEPTAPISTYLFCFAAGKFNVYSETREGRTINFYYRETNKNKLDSNLADCMDLQFKALAFDSDYLQSEYPFSKFDFVEIPGFGVGGMEHPGSIFYKGDEIFLEKPSATDIYERKRVIGHEVSHIWFGDIVTMKWFNEVWLKEVFANYMGDKFANTQGIDKNFNKKFLLGNFPTAYSKDRFPSSNPILLQLPNLDQAGLAYGEISYHKTPIMMHQLELLIGEENFRKGIQDYIKTYKGGNADFSQLIEQFKKYTTADLDYWLEGWVKKQGRPIIHYTIDTTGGIINQFSFTQYGEYDTKRILPQQFDMMLYYDSSTTETIHVNMTKASQKISEIIGKKAPALILFNTSGEGYGVFPIDKAFVNKGLRHTSVVTRASAIINLFELMLRSKEKEPDQFSTVYKPRPKEMLNLLCSLVSWETDRQLLERELRYISTIYWNLLKPATRQKVGPQLEETLLNAIQQQTIPNRTSIFRTYIKIAESAKANDSLYFYWSKRKAPYDISIDVSDFTSIATHLALMNYKVDEVLKTELDSLKNFYADHKSFLLLTKALSNNVQVRDSFFTSLLKYEGRKEGSDVISSLYLLHHPLRQKHSKKYIKQSLAILADVLHTNDIFFAPDWISATLSSYNDKETVQLLKSYLSKSHPEVPFLLLQIVRQNADWVFRAEAVSE
ncbi:M1 family aminopeptidase [Ferruginibacter sp. SUN002]|uniref:M1 family aminopeptidase n=1 Tax=Ferruginibacter sp. SUN002 TaxID=2937789 RepID=UPI003D36DDA0